mgnify:CR=1 FL=1
MKIKINKKINEMSSMGGGAVQGHVDNRKKKLQEATEINSKVIEDTEENYISEITVDGIAGNGEDYKIVQELTIKKNETSIGMTKIINSEIVGEIEGCLPNSITPIMNDKKLTTHEIDFQIQKIEFGGEDLYFDDYESGIFPKMDSLLFIKYIMQQIGGFILKNLDKVFYFYGIHDEFVGRSDVESKRTRLYSLFLKRLIKKLPGDWRVRPLNDVNQILFWKCPDQDSGEQKELVFESQDLEFTNEELDLIHEMYSSAGIMGMGSGRIPAERSPEGHERYVRMRHDTQGLKNFKQNRYFAEDEEKKPKIKIKIRKNLGERCQKGYKTHPKRKTKKMFGKTYRNCVKAEGKDAVSKEISKLMKKKDMKQDQAVAIALSMKEKGKLEEKDPKKGTGKKPKGTGRRLYTDENPNDTVSVKFSTVQDIKDTFSKASFKSKSHKRQSQIINLVHQRVRAAYQNAKDPEVKKRLKKAFDYAKKRKEASKEKTKRMNK